MQYVLLVTLVIDVINLIFEKNQKNSVKHTHLSCKHIKDACFCIEPIYEVSAYVQEFSGSVVKMI